MLKKITNDYVSDPFQRAGKNWFLFQGFVCHADLNLYEKKITPNLFLLWCYAQNTVWWQMK